MPNDFQIASLPAEEWRQGQDSPRLAPDPEGHWRILIQKTGNAKNHLGRPMDVCNVYIVSPEGAVTTFENCHSGGFGYQHHFKGLPGLNHDLPNSGPEYNATYQIQWEDAGDFRGFVPFAPIDKARLPPSFATPDLKGGFLRFLSHKEQTSRGVPMEKPGQPGAFAFHVDGPTYMNRTGAPDGTEGCIGLQHRDGERFFKLIQKIYEGPIAQRPEIVGVLPQIQIDRIRFSADVSPR